MGHGETSLSEVETTSSETPNSEPSSADASWRIAVAAADEKQAKDLVVLDLRGITSFADFFVICTGNNQRQVQTIADEIDKQLRATGERAISVEGYSQGEWILADYGDFLVHVFSEKAREFYDLQRLWRAAKVVPLPAA
jgi:ribosome-associated protein